MNLSLSGRLYFIIVVTIITIGIGYWYSYNLRSKVNETWRQTLWDDCTNRMREINVKKKQIFSSDTSPNIKIETEGQTLHLKKDAGKFLTAKEKDFLADQVYLSLENPVKIEKLDSLFRLKLKENGFTFKTAVSLYNNETEKKIFYGQEDVEVLHDYLKLTYKVDIRDVILLEGYAKGGWLENLFWGSGFYLLLSLILFGSLVLLVMEKRKLKSLNQLLLEKEQFHEIPQTLSYESVPLDIELITDPVEEHIQSELNMQPKAAVIFLDEEKLTLVYADKKISLAPKVFGLFYQLAQGKDYFQSYNFLLQNLWSDEDNVDKKHLEQIVIRLRKNLKDIPLSIDSIRGSGYQIKGVNHIKINIK